MHENSIFLFQRYALPLFADGMKVLEIGPDSFASSLRRCVSAGNLVWETLDIFDSPQLTFPKSSPSEFPIPDDRYDIVLSRSVIGHVPRIWRWVAELRRVVKPGGAVITINPVSWPCLEAPIDCWRIFPEGMKVLPEDAGLVLEKWLWGSLELPAARRCIPGRSFPQHPAIRRWGFHFLRLIGGRIEKAFDNIMIARKPLRAEGPTRA